jgi:hypothetical protein
MEAKLGDVVAILDVLKNGRFVVQRLHAISWAVRQETKTNKLIKSKKKNNNNNNNNK